MAPVIGGACNFKSEENRGKNSPLKSSLKENVKHMYRVCASICVSENYSISSCRHDTLRCPCWASTLLKHDKFRL